MKYREAYWCVLSFILLLGVIHGADASTLKTIDLKRKITEISTLQHILEEKIAIAVETRDQLQKQTHQLAKEIRRVRDQQNIRSYQAAVNHQRIDYNIKLIHQLSEYIKRLNKRIQYFRTGIEMLAFLLQQIRDDLQLIRILDDMQIDKLIYRVNEVLDEYIPDTKKHIINVENIPWRSPENIWNEIIKKDLQVDLFQ